jgi:hypothetical protein
LPKSIGIVQIFSSFPEETLIFLPADRGARLAFSTSFFQVLNARWQLVVYNIFLFVFDVHYFLIFDPMYGMYWICALK